MPKESFEQLVGEPNASVGDFLLAVSVLESHGVLPIAGGFFDQSAWFVQAYSVYQGELSEHMRTSAVHDAAWYRDKHAPGR